MKINSVGTDIVSIKKLKKIIESTHGEAFINKTFTEKEKKYFNNKSDKLNHIATTFAGKEAVLKALGTGITNLKDVEIIRKKNGQPIVRLHNKLRDKKILISLSYDEDYAIGFALIS